MNLLKQDAVLEKYQEIRARYRAQAEGLSGAVSPPITDRHGFFLNRTNALTERVAGLDKLFYSLIHGIVEDPDYAVRKDAAVYERMMRDPQIYYCLMVRKAAISSLPWIVKPKAALAQDETAKRFALSCERRLHQIPRFSELLDNVMDALLPGMSLNEVVWKLSSKGEYTVKDHFPVNKDRIKFDKNGALYLLSPQAPTYGKLVPPYKFIRHTFNTTDGSWKKPETAGYAFYGRGLADTPLYHYFHFKMIALKYFMKELERYGMPFKILYTGPQNTLLADKLHEIMLALKNDAVVNIPGKKGDINVDIAKVASSKNVFGAFIDYVDRLITKTILGQELMTEMPGVGSYAAAQVHQSVFGLINTRDRMQVKDTLNRTLLTFDAQLNTPNLAEEYIPEFGFKKSAVEDTGIFLETVMMAGRLGLEVSEEQVREFTGLRAPAEGEKTIVFPPQEQMTKEPNGNGNQNQAAAGRGNVRQTQQRRQQPQSRQQNAQTKVR